MAVDDDAPRGTDDVTTVAELREVAPATQATLATLEEDDPVAAESFELAGADLSREDLVVRVLPKHDDEFTCGRCFLIVHQSHLAYHDAGLPVCAECVA